MDIFLAYILTFFIIFVMMPIVYYLLRFMLWLVLDFWGCGKPHQEDGRDQQDRRLTFGHIYDRQGNIFTIANETANNPLPHRCTDFFYVDPATEDAARIRAQLEKDEKDLPTYEEVMAMSLAQAAAGSQTPYTASNTSVATTDTTVPPYSEANRSATSPVQLAATALQNAGATAGPRGNAPAVTGVASTSRAAAAVSTSTPTTIAVTIDNSVSNTSV